MIGGRHGRWGVLVAVGEGGVGAPLDRDDAVGDGRARDAARDVVEPVAHPESRRGSDRAAADGVSELRCANDGHGHAGRIHRGGGGNEGRDDVVADQPVGGRGVDRDGAARPREISRIAFAIGSARRGYRARAPRGIGEGIGGGRVHGNTGDAQAPRAAGDEHLVGGGGGGQAVRFDRGRGHRAPGSREASEWHHLGKTEDHRLSTGHYLEARVGPVRAVRKLARGHGMADVVGARNEGIGGQRGGRRRVGLPIAHAHAVRIAILPVLYRGRDVDRA